MFRRLLKCVREYKRPTIITLVLIFLEAVIDVFIPKVTADLINTIQREGQVEMKYLLTQGAILVGLALASLACGGIAGFTCAKASAGFAKNLRHDVFEKIQGFSFENIDKFSSSSLVTRMTTDIANIQMAYMMVIRTAVRSPMMLVLSTVMAFVEGGTLAMAFVVVIPVLIVGLLLISRKAMPAFRSVFRRYDRLNESIEENVRGMRVVKGFSREEYEKEKFGAAAESIRAA